MKPLLVLPPALERFPGGTMAFAAGKTSLKLALLIAVGASVCLVKAALPAPNLDSGRIIHWEFDEGSGTTALDSSSNGNTGTIIGAVYVPDRFDTALSFAGTGQYVFASDAQSGGTSGSGLDMGTRDWTVSAWIKTTASGMLVTKMGFMGGSNPDGWGVSLSENGTVGAHIRKLGAGEVNVFSGDGRTVNDGQWHHLAVVFNRAGNLIRYVDGLPSGSQHDLAQLIGQSIDNTNQFRIGARDGAGHEIFFNGLTDEVRVYDRALGTVEIAALAGVTIPPEPPVSWSAPMTLVSAHGRVAVGNRVHVVGHNGDNLVHRSSPDNGATWGAPTTVAPASENYPMQYGGLFAAADTVYLLTAAGHMGPSSQHLDFRKSTNNGATWSAPIRITGSGQQIRRANIMANGDTVHVFGGQSGAGGYGTGIYYFRSTNGGVNWENGVLLYAESDASARMAVDGTTVHVAFGAKLTTNSFGGRTHHMRSIDNGVTWSEPVFIGEDSAESNVQARQQIAAADGRVIVMWQREALLAGGPLPAERLGYNCSEDGGVTWTGLQLLPGDIGINRNHHQIWMERGGGLHVAWCHGSPGESTSPTGYKFSPDYGASWRASETAINTSGGNLPHGIVADTNWVHVIAEPGAGTYARRPVPPPNPVFTSVRQEDAQVIFEWSGSGTLQWTTDVTGPWQAIPDATSPHTVAVEPPSRFYRIELR